MKSIQIDVGGTWSRFRSGDHVKKLPTPSALRFPHSSREELLQRLIQLLVTYAPAGGEAHVSLGAAYDQEVDIAYGSAPLWGPGRWEVPFKRLLENEKPDVAWTVVNDVTAGLAHFAHLYARPGDRYVTYLTVSSGIALRTVHMPTGRIEVSREGLQGEVGHLLAMCTANDAVRSLMCDCGGRGHIAAISSGPAIPRVADALGIQSWDKYDSEQNSHEYELTRNEELTRVIVEPIAHLVRFVKALQPHVDLIGIGGGVPAGIGRPYERELTQQLSVAQSYADGGILAESRVVTLGNHEVFPEIGARFIAENLFVVEK